MADLLRTWLVDEVQLSRDVVSFEKECANGYLIAEVLAKHNQQPDFAEGAFRDDDRADTQISNFIKIEPTLVRLGIRFDARRARLLMSKQRNAALTLLYEIKTAVAPLNKVAVSLRPPPSGGIKAARLGLRSRAAPHDKAQSELFAKSIRLKADNQNELFLNKHMRNFGRGVERLWAQRDAMVRARAGAHKAALNQQRLRQLHLLRTNRMLRAAKEEHGVREWQRNMEVRLAQGQRAKRIDREQKLRAAERAELSDAEAAAEMSEGLAGFESAARRLGIEMEATGKEGLSEGEEAAELMRIARQLRRSGPARPPSGPTRLAEQEAYFDAMEERLGTRQANAASAEAILRRLRRRKLDADELHDKRRRRRAAFVAAGGALRASRLEAERRRWLAACLRSRSKAEAKLDSECADIARLEGAMRLRRARADEDMAVQALRDEAAALRWDGELWAAATAAHALEAADVCRRLDTLRAERRESRRQAVESMCRDEATRLVETALAAASVREAFSQLGHVGQGWEAVVQGSSPLAPTQPLAGPSSGGSASVAAEGSQASTEHAADAGSATPAPEGAGPDVPARAAVPWEGQAGVGVELWDRLLRARVFADLHGGQNLWAGLADGSPEAGRLDALVTALWLQAAAGDQDAEIDAVKGGAKAKKAAAAAAEKKRAKKGGSSKGGAAGDYAGDGAEEPGPVPTRIVRALLGAALGDAFTAGSAALVADSEGGGGLAEATLRIEAVDDVVADDRGAEAKEDDSEGKDADDGLPSGPLNSVHPEKGEDALFAELIAGRDALAALAAENCDPNCDSAIRRLVLSPEQVSEDTCSLGRRWAPELASVGREAAEAEAAARASGADMRWWCPSDEILVKAVHVALKALTADVADAAVAPAEAGSGSTAGGSPLAAEPAEDASEDCPDAGAVPEWREGLEDAARDAGLRGWLLVGFPRSAAQAAALEKLLTGWAPRTPAASPWTTFDASATDARWAQVCGGDLLGDEVRAAAFSTGYIPTLRSGPPLYHVDVLPPPYALDHKGALERAAISSAAARSMEAALLRREAGAKEASADAWFERAGALRVLRWHNPVVESRAREELKRGEGSDRVRKRALADVAALDAEAASWAAARRDDDAQPRQSGDWVLLRGTSPSGGPDQQVVETESWAEFEAPGRCLWAVGRRDLLADHELFSAAARALAHGFRDGHERATRSAAAAAAEAARRAAAVESLRDAFKSFLKAAEGVLHDSPAPQEAGPGEAAGDESARAATDASPDADAPAPAEGAAESASPADHATAGGEAHGTEVHAQPAAAEVRRPDLQPPLLPAWLATWSSAQPADGSESGGSGSGDAATGELDRGSADDVPADQAVAPGGAEAAGAEGAEEATSAGSEAASAAVDGPAAASAPAGASTAATGEEAAEVEAVATIDSNDAVVEARRALAIASVSVGLRVPVLVLPSWSSQEQATRSAVALARAAASSILRRWEGATRAYGVTAETHAWRWGRELEAAASRSARVAGAFAQAMCSPFGGYDEALQRLHTALCRVPASSRSRPEVQAALEADVDAVAAGMRVAAGKRFAAASELAASVSVQGWADAALWSLTASALAIASAERRRLAEARAALLQYAILAGGAVPVGAAPDGAEALHACAILRLAGTAGLSSLADALESGSTAAEAAEADAAGGGAAGKKKAAAAKDKAAAAKKKGAASGKDKKKGKGGAGGGGGEDDEDDEDEAVASAEVGVPVAADFAWRVGHLAPPVVLPQPVSCLLAAPSAEDSAAPEAGAPDAQGAVQAMVSACGEDESQLEADVQGRGAARVEAATAASLALAVGALVRDAVGSLLPFEVPAAAPVPGPAVSARQLGGGSAVAEDAEEPASRSVAWGVASAAMAEAEAFAAAVVWDSGRLRRARARVGRALVKAEKRRTAAAAAARTAVAHVEAEAQAELDAAAAALAEAQAGGGKDKKKGGAASKKDKKQAAASGVELPDMAEVLLPLSSVLPVPPVPAAAALAAGLSVGEQELASLAGLDPVELGRAIVSGRAAAQLRAEARIPDSVLSALEAEARHSAGRLRVLRRALGRAAERIASLAVQNTQQAVATAEARLRGELSAIESARIELRRDVQLGRAPVAPLRVQSRLARSEELLLPQTGAGASALKSGGGSGLAAVATPATRDAVVVELKQLRSCKQVSVLAEAGVAREAPGTDGLTPSGFGVLVSALRAVAEHSGNPALMLPAAAAGDKQLEAAAAWNAVFEDAVPPERVCFGPDGAPLAEASLDTAECEPATASVADAAAGSTGDAGAREEAVDAQGSGLQADGAMVPVVPAGAWAPETEAAADLATERRLTAEDAAHMTSDALDASLGRALYRLWTDSSGTTRWGRMVFTLRALASAPAPLGPELSSPQPESAAAPTPAAGAAPAPPAAEASTAGGQGALQASTAAVRAARDAGALHPDAVAIAEASCISAAVAAAAAAAEASAGKGGKGAKRK
ncbi:hypothetical protein FNF28_02257 [Cafeteria roenbergensis]|uniref:CH-like domain-containing protein n=1 Tax=Cafeteria roenbergensis TaxID=33653 RepID=A0A5A8DZL5_CAFRO|nr:hypothetical protein FNF28_02257 [Cafeteria roenbergensis]